ncbi:MAG: 6,7-dimethyl-8-ribityllumazine synthase [Prevotellaceae bacterium]|jgi:6,7-dimethyl-8-ribityllumazine synthase|nr:6,7-dimethyl-8-ribityllumazine synthase [Prevotellaceae bacterium]
MATELQNTAESPENLPEGKNRVITIIVSQWNEKITSALLDGAMKTLKKAGVEDEDLVVIRVPGCFELPYAAQQAALLTSPHAIICLGCVIRGETPHFDYVCQAATHGILHASLNTSIPVIFGVLTVDNLQQAEDRAGGKYGNKGVEAACTALEMTKFTYLDITDQF